MKDFDTMDIDERELAVICSIVHAGTRGEALAAVSAHGMTRACFSAMADEFEQLTVAGPEIAFPDDIVCGEPAASHATKFAPELIAWMVRRNAEEAKAAKLSPRMMTLGSFPEVLPEKDNPDILIKGRWLERGGSAFLISTAGTGKSIWMTQFAIQMVRGIPFSGLQPWKDIRCWIIQSEDSPSRVSIDRDDIIAGLDESCPVSAGGKNLAWRDAADEVVFLRMTGLTGAGFIQALREELQFAKDVDALPDVVIINPFLAFLGGDVSSNKDVGAFLRGGYIGKDQTEGLQAVLEEFRVAALIAHHTGKPPSEAEIKSWIKSSMPEYQCVGASDITNWGRSFLTMMRVPGFPRAVMLTAGKNGGALGWDELGGARRRFLVWSDAPSCSGAGSRHFWREPTPEEVDQFSTALFNAQPTASRAARIREKEEHDKGAEENARILAGHIAEEIYHGNRVTYADAREWARSYWIQGIADRVAKDVNRNMLSYGLAYSLDCYIIVDRNGREVSCDPLF